jgi:hypothetical protein
MPRLPLLPVAIVASAVALYRSVRPALRTHGASEADQRRGLPGDGLIPGEGPSSTMAVEIDAPPSAVWPWLVQMGTHRAGYYSWDRLDNGGHASANTVHPEWQELRAGDRVPCSGDGSFSFEVAHLEPERSLVLRNVMGLLPPRQIASDADRPVAFTDGRWEFFLEPLAGDRTRLLVRSSGAGFTAIPCFDLVHWIMQTKQFAELKRRAEAAV